MKALLLISVLPLLCCSCGRLPKDTERSLEQIRARHSVRIGLIAGSWDEEGRGQRLIQAVAVRAGARPALTSGAAEVLLTDLEEGRLDLVVGTMATMSPWTAKVHVLPALSKADDKRPTGLVAAARNGENAWITLVHDEVEELRAQP